MAARGESLEKVRRAKRLAWGLFLFFFPLGALLLRISDAVRLPLFLALVPYFFLFVASLLLMIAVPCPRCEKRFFVMRFGRLGVLNPVARRCQVCALELRDEDR